MSGLPGRSQGMLTGKTKLTRSTGHGWSGLGFSRFFYYICILISQQCFPFDRATWEPGCKTVKRMEFCRPKRKAIAQGSALGNSVVDTAMVLKAGLLRSNKASFLVVGIKIHAQEISWRILPLFLPYKPFLSTEHKALVLKCCRVQGSTRVDCSDISLSQILYFLAQLC